VAVADAVAVGLDETRRDGLNVEFRARFVIIAYWWFELAGCDATEPDLYREAPRFVKGSRGPLILEFALETALTPLGK
jgi:hypothetical protein